MTLSKVQRVSQCSTSNAANLLTQVLSETTHCWVRCYPENRFPTLQKKGLFWTCSGLGIGLHTWKVETGETGIILNKS